MPGGAGPRRTHRARATTWLAAAIAVAAAPALADWRTEFPVLRFGFVAGQNAVYRIVQAEPFRAYLEEQLGVKVELVPAPGYRALLDAQARSNLGATFLSATAFVTAEAECRCVEPLAVSTDLDGARGFRAILIARARSPITSLASAKGARLAVSGGDSVAGRLLPFSLFAAEGMSEGDFSALVPASGPERAVDALLAGQADVALGWTTADAGAETGVGRGVLAAMVAEGTLTPGMVRVVWTSPLIPNATVAVRSALPEEMKAALRDALVRLGAYPEILDSFDRTGGGGFLAADEAAYAPLRPLVAPAP